MENKNYLMRGNYFLDAILMATYIQKDVDMTIGSKIGKDHHKVDG